MASVGITGLGVEVLVVAADCRLAEPGSDAEFPMGDAGAALCVGPGPATIEAVEARLEDIVELEAAFQAISSATEDAREGVRAFAERRPPRFAGR